MRSLGLVTAAAMVAALPAQATEPAWTGAWDVTATFAQGRSAATMKLEADGASLKGEAGPLDEAGFLPLSVRGRPVRGRLVLEFLYGEIVVGRVVVTNRKGRVEGDGALYEVPVRLVLTRPPAARPAPRIIDFEPTRYTIQFSARTEPVLRIRPGDTVRTSTLDNMGRDGAMRFRWMPGNTLTGPFWIEGAMPGDTLAVHIEEIALNRDSAEMWGGTLSEKAVGAHPQTAEAGWGRQWVLDRARGVARPKGPAGRIGGIELPLDPMIGSIGVAPPLNQSWFAGDLAFHGGNLDYQRLREGATIYLPVWQAGALLALGDGHALQGDGEITGQGLETSLDVQFRVELIRGKSLGQVWMEDGDYVMVSGIENSIDDSLRMATAGMARWLKDRYGLNDSEIATLLGGAIEYDIAEVVDPRPHVVARISTRVLAGSRPSRPRRTRPPGGARLRGRRRRRRAGRPGPCRAARRWSPPAGRRSEPPRPRTDSRGWAR
jgi:acetamidase/formamidase